MRIKRFNEAESAKLENEKADQILEQLNEFLAQMKDRQTSTDQMINVLEIYSTPNDKTNDQVDDTIAALRVVKKAVDDVIDNIDTAIENLNSYKEEGSEYLYSETKPKS